MAGRKSKWQSHLLIVPTKKMHFASYVVIFSLVTDLLRLCRCSGVSLSNMLLMLQMCFNAFDKAADLDVLDHPVLNFMYYLVSIWYGCTIIAMASDLLALSFICFLPLMFWWARLVVLLCRVTVGGDSAIFLGSVYPEEVATEAGDYSIPSNPLICMEKMWKAWGCGRCFSWIEA